MAKKMFILTLFCMGYYLNGNFDWKIEIQKGMYEKPKVEF